MLRYQNLMTLFYLFLTSTVQNKKKKKRNIHVQTIAIYDKKEVRKVIMNISKLRDELKLKTSIRFNRQKISVLVCFFGN